MEFEGKIIEILPAREGISKAGSPWKTQTYVIQEEGQAYPRKMAFDVFGEERINSMCIAKGEKLKVYIDIDAREYNGRWYNEISAWKVERTNMYQVPEAQTPRTGTEQPSYGQQPTIEPQGIDDLPF